MNSKQGMLYHFSILQKNKLRNQNTKRNVELSPQLQELPFKLGGDRLAGILLHRDAGAVLLDHHDDDEVVIVVLTMLMLNISKCYAGG